MDLAAGAGPSEVPAAFDLAWLTAGEHLLLVLLATPNTQWNRTAAAFPTGVAVTTTTLNMPHFQQTACFLVP